MDNVYPRRAGISSFGAGGSNAHVLIEEYEAPISQAIQSGTPHLIVLSARNEDRLKASAERLLEFLKRDIAEASSSGSNISLPDIAYTLQTGREAMKERLLRAKRRDEGIALEDACEKLGI